jgi:hypothetical protein
MLMFTSLAVEQGWWTRITDSDIRLEVRDKLCWKISRNAFTETIQCRGSISIVSVLGLGISVLYVLTLEFICTVRLFHLNLHIGCWSKFEQCAFVLLDACATSCSAILYRLGDHLFVLLFFREARRLFSWVWIQFWKCCSDIVSIRRIIIVYPFKTNKSIMAWIQLTLKEMACRSSLQPGKKN